MNTPLLIGGIAFALLVIGVALWYFWPNKTEESPAPGQPVPNVPQTPGQVQPVPNVPRTPGQVQPVTILSNNSIFVKLFTTPSAVLIANIKYIGIDGVDLDPTLSGAYGPSLFTLQSPSALTSGVTINNVHLDTGRTYNLVLLKDSDDGPVEVNRILFNT